MRLLTSARTAAIGLLVASIAVAQAPATPAATPSTLPESWRLSASVGAWQPRHPLVIAPGGASTTLRGGTAFQADLSYDVTRRIAIYAGGLLASSSLSPGAALQSGGTGTSDRASVVAALGGLVLTVPGGVVGRFDPTVRLGGGLKGYRFDLGDGANQWRPVGDFGLGLRGGTGGSIDMLIEARYLASTVDQGKLPTRSIVPQVQRQGDLMLSVGISLRP